jgi:hypothetical protein
VVFRNAEKTDGFNDLFFCFVVGIPQRDLGLKQPVAFFVPDKQNKIILYAKEDLILVDAGINKIFPFRHQFTQVKYALPADADDLFGVDAAYEKKDSGDQSQVGPAETTSLNSGIVIEKTGNK